MRNARSTWMAVWLTIGILWIVLMLARGQHEAIPEMPASATPRSREWPHTRALHLVDHPNCEACGGREQIEVHHIQPFHEHPDLELDPTNLFTLCREHHFRIGHDPDGTGPMKPNWSASNKNVVRDSHRLRQKLKP